MVQINQNPLEFSGFCFPVRLIGLVFEPSKNLKKPLKTDNQSFERL